jgi:hypothetical protein
VPIGRGFQRVSREVALVSMYRGVGYP